MLPIVAQAQVLKKKKKENLGAGHTTTSVAPKTPNDSLIHSVLLGLDSVVASGKLPTGWKAWSGICPHPYGYSPNFGWPYEYQLQWLCPEQAQPKKDRRSEFQVVSMSKDRAAYTAVFWLYPDRSGRSARITVGDPGDWQSYYFQNCCWSENLNKNATEALEALAEFIKNKK